MKYQLILVSNSPILQFTTPVELKDKEESDSHQ